MRPQDDNSHRISFMSNDSTPYTSLLMRMRAVHRDSSIYGSDIPTPETVSSTLSQQINFYDSYMSSLRSDSLGGHETILLDMVRRQSQEAEDEIHDNSLDLHEDDQSEDPIDACVHGLNMRMTERSVSRSRFSRISTRRDMDIPSILAFNASTTPGPLHRTREKGQNKDKPRKKHRQKVKDISFEWECLCSDSDCDSTQEKVALEIPAFQKTNTSEKENIPRWSIRRSVCPVCSQKWKDKSSIKNVKYSGLKRNSSSELPSVIAPARLRASITMAYVPRPALAVVNANTAVDHGPMRNTSAAWQFTRARRFRVPKPQLPPPEATAPPSATAPLAQKDLDTRVQKFLSD